MATGTVSAVAIYLSGGRSLPSVELRLITGEDPTGARDLLIKMWNQANPDITVREDVISSGSGDEWRIMLQRARNGEADLLNLDLIDVPQFAAEKLISPVTLDGGGLLEPLGAIHRVPGESSSYWAVPFNTDVGMLFTRLRDGQAEVPTPQNLSELLSAIPDNSQQFAGVLRPGASTYHEAFVVNVLEHAASERPGVLEPVEDNQSAAERVSYDLELWQAALSPLQEAIQRNRIIASTDEARSRDDFGKPGSPCRYMRNWPVKYRELQQGKNPDVRAGRVRVGRLDVGVLGGQSLAVASASPHRRRARDFIEFATSDVAQKILAAHGLPPTTIGAYSDENITASIPHLQEVREAVENALPRPAHRSYRQFADVVRTHVARFLQDDGVLSEVFVDEMKQSLA